MKSNIGHTFKSALAKVVVVAMLVMSFQVVSPSVAKAASTPKISKTTSTILVGAKYDLNVNNKVSKSKYTWTTSNKKIATVNQKGVVTAVNKGVVKITCKVKTPSKKSYTLKCTVTVLKGAKTFKISNKVTALNVGQTYDLNRTMTPSTANDKTTWSSSDKSIASPNKNGKFTAKKAGTVTITGKTKSGAKDSVTIKVVDKDGTVTTQAELDALLGSGAANVTIKTTAAVNFTIKAGTYAQNLVVDAPNSDVTNSGVFKSIVIKNIKANTWYENAVGNLLSVLAANSRIVVDANASAKIEVSETGAKLTIVNNGKVEELVITKEAAVDISGTSTQSVPVSVNVPNISITTSVPLNLKCSQKVELTLLKGAEATKITATTEAAVPTIKGDVTVKVTVGSGDSAKEVTVIGTPIPSAPVVVPSTGSAIDVQVIKNGTTTTYILAKSYKELASIKVGYKNATYTVTGEMLTALKGYLDNDKTTTQKWLDTTDTTKTYDGHTVRVVATKDSKTKTVTFDGILTYTVTVDGGVVTVKGGTNTYTITKAGDTTLVISGASNDVVFTPSFK